MNLPTPRWWYVREPPARLTRALLRPASWVWAEVTARRIKRTVPFDPGVPVICVGGLTVGGTGKTPVVREVLARLRAAGVEAHGLSRGYGGRLAGPVRVDPARHTAADVGDEPLMLATNAEGGDAPVWVARDRVAGARAMVAAGAGAIVMDDGHQNPGLRKTLSLVVVDGETRGAEWPFGDGAVFPAGPMREPLAVGLSRADAVVLLLPADLQEPDRELLKSLRSPLLPRSGGSTPPRDRPKADPRTGSGGEGGSPDSAGAASPLRHGAEAPRHLPRFAGEEKIILIARLEPLGPPPPGPQLGFAGIAKPWKFERALQAAGCELADFAAFPDHAPWREADLRALADRAQALGAGLVTTEKDWSRLPPAWRERVTAWPVRARFEDEAALDQLLQPAGPQSADPLPSNLGNL